MLIIVTTCRLFFVDVLEVGNDPLVFPLVVGRGFLLELAASDDGRGAASFITIFAWISSSFEALTFLGQNNVTNLRWKLRYLTSHRMCPHTSKDADATFLGLLRQPA